MDIRLIRTHAEYLACVALQTATWGEAFREIVPATILKVSQRLGGVTAGAFDDDGTLLGFVFGMTGVEHGDIVHWSDMLAVRADAQNHGVGRRLKEFQRDLVREIGARRMYWTYDPLVARNAHFNLNRLGASVSEYVPDMYGTDTGSKVHAGLGTDRFILVWPLSGGDRSDAPATNRPDAPVLNEGTSEGRDADPARFDGQLPETVRVEIPMDIFAVQAESAENAALWRRTTRRAFQWALAHGYTVSRFAHDSGAHGHYVLARGA